MRSGLRHTRISKSKREALNDKSRNVCYWLMWDFHRCVLFPLAALLFCFPFLCLFSYSAVCYFSAAKRNNAFGVIIYVLPHKWLLTNIHSAFLQLTSHSVWVLWSGLLNNGQTVAKKRLSNRKICKQTKNTNMLHTARIFLYDEYFFILHQMLSFIMRILLLC